MCIAVSQNDIQKIQLYISCGVPLSLQDYDGRTPLHIAGSFGYKTLFKTLVKAGADTSTKDNFSNVPKLSLRDENVDDSPAPKYELSASVKINAQREETRLSSDDFSFDYSLQTKRMLISVILCNLVNEDNLHKIREILIGVEDLSVIMDYDFRTPLHIAAVKDRGEIAQFLINRGAKVNALDRWRRTPLYEAVQSKSKKVAKILAMHQGGFCLSSMEFSIFLNRIIKSGDL